MSMQITQLPHYTSLLNTTILNVFKKKNGHVIIEEKLNLVQFFFSMASENSDWFISVGADWVWWGELDLSRKLRKTELLLLPPLFVFCFFNIHIRMQTEVTAF